MLKQASHILHSFALSLHTGMVYPCTVGRHTCRPTCATPLFVLGVGCGIRPFPHSRQAERGHPSPLSTGWTMPPPAGLFLHAGGQPRQYDCLIQRFSLWSGFMTLWAGIATPQQAQEIVARQYLDTTLFCCPAGVRSPLPSREDVQHEGERQPHRRGRGRYGYVSTISSSVGSSGTDTPPRHVSWHGRQSYSSAGILSASEPSMSIICLRMASLC